MSKNSFLKTLLLSFSILYFSPVLNAQKVTNENLVGCWKIDSAVFLQPMDDSAALQKQFSNIITCFESPGKFSTKMKNGNSYNMIGTGTYNIRPDGKTLDQKRDGDNEGEDDSAEVFFVTENKMRIVTGEVVLIFVRL